MVVQAALRRQAGADQAEQQQGGEGAGEGAGAGRQRREAESRQPHRGEQERQGEAARGPAAARAAAIEAALQGGDQPADPGDRVADGLVERVRVAGRRLDPEGEGEDGERVGKRTGQMDHSVWNVLAREPAPIAHGGDLGALRLAFPDAPDPWLDLSTGINPVPYPVPPVEASAWTRLPEAAEVQALRAAAAAAYGAPDAAHVVPAPGTQILIETLPRLLAPTRVAVLGPTYAEHAAAWARAGHTVAEIAELAEAGEARVVVVVDPNNPDGRTHPLAARRALAGALGARGGLLVADEAFADLEPGHSLCPHAAPGLVVLRSFGKTYGLAGLRLGFAVADPGTAARIAAALGPWAVSGPALAIGTAALSDGGVARRGRAGPGGGCRPPRPDDRPGRRNRHRRHVPVPDRGVSRRSGSLPAARGRRDRGAAFRRAPGAPPLRPASRESGVVPAVAGAQVDRIPGGCGSRAATSTASAENTNPTAQTPAQPTSRKACEPA